jgi:hypothetical protein
MNMTDLIPGIVSGFATGIGVGLANWVFIKRLEEFEKKVRKR